MSKGRKQNGFEKHWMSKSWRDQFAAATYGREPIDGKLAAWLRDVDLITAQRKNGLVVTNSEQAEYKLDCEKIGERFMDLWWEGKKSKCGNAFRQMALEVELTRPKQPERQFIAFMRLFVMAGKPPKTISRLVKIYDQFFRPAGFGKTSYQQIDRICTELGYPSQKDDKRGPKPKKLKTK